MSGSWSRLGLPRLDRSNHTVTSPPATRCNCIAWAAGEDFRFWWPDSLGIAYWPHGIERSETTEAFVCAFGTLGFSPCPDGDLKPGIEKIALYGKGPEGREVPAHAARQLESGRWTSKLGPFVDIEHLNVEDVAGPVYGRVVCYLCRQRK